MRTVPLYFVALALVGVSFAACNPRNMPGFSQEAKRQEDRITRETEEAIKKSPALQDLDHLCTQVLPRPERFQNVNKSRDFQNEKFLSYGYHSSLDYERVMAS